MRNSIRALALLAVPALLLGCGKDKAPDPDKLQIVITNSTSSPVPSPPVLGIDGQGLRVIDPQSGYEHPLAFGMDLQMTLAALAFRGPPRTGHMEECGAGPLDYAKWDDGFTLYAQNGAFMGWFADTQAAGKLSTASGIGPGSTRAELDGAYAAEVFESTLGTEFLAGDLGGLLDGTGKQARITALWAGLGCNFR